MINEQNNFIEKIGNASIEYYNQYLILPSLTIAQAILESNWGRSKLSTECNNFFGMKWVNECNCDYREYSTKEQNIDGSYSTVKAKFRKYNSIEEGIKGYYDFLQYQRYQNLKGVTDCNKVCDLIREDGWATSLSYASNLKKLISTHVLTNWDNKAILKNKPKATKYETGNYKVIATSLKVRSGPGTNYAQRKFNEMTSSARNQNAMFKSSGQALYKQGIIFTAISVIKNSDIEYWAETPSGYVALEYAGTSYVNKV